MLEGVDHSVTVFRSADSSAEEDAQAVLDMLAGHGVAGTLLDDRAPGVLSGSWEVRVAPADSAQAEALIAANPIEDEFAGVSESHDFDLVTVFRSAGTGTKTEALSVKAMLESNGVYAMMVADARLPYLPEEVRVPRESVTHAKRLIDAALAAGAAGADEAEASTES
jgi:hypothetical protein